MKKNNEKEKKKSKRRRMRFASLFLLFVLHDSLFVFPAPAN